MDLSNTTVSLAGASVLDALKTAKAGPSVSHHELGLALLEAMRRRGLDIDRPRATVPMLSLDWDRVQQTAERPLPAFLRKQAE